MRWVCVTCPCCGNHRHVGLWALSLKYSLLCECRGTLEPIRTSAPRGESVAVHIENSTGIVFQDCDFDGADIGVRAVNSSVEVRSTKIRSRIGIDIVGTSPIKVSDVTHEVIG